MATFRLLTASLLQAMRSTDYAAPSISQRSAVPILFQRVVVTSAVRCCTVHNNRRTVQQRTAEVTTTRRTMEDRNALITADLRDINAAA